MSNILTWLRRFTISPSLLPHYREITYHRTSLPAKCEEKKWLDKVVGAVGIGNFFILLMMASNLGAAKSIVKWRSQVSMLLINTYFNYKNIDLCILLLSGCKHPLVLMLVVVSTP